MNFLELFQKLQWIGEQFYGGAVHTVWYVAYVFVWILTHVRGVLPSLED